MIGYGKLLIWDHILDIKPFSQPFPDFWTSIGPESYVAFGLAVALFLYAIFCLMSDTSDGAIYGVMLAFFMAFAGFILGVTSMDVKYDADYSKKISEFKESLADDGFKIVSGTPDLKPNTQSSMLLSYDGKNFDCALFSPEDVNENIVFSCGEAKLNLEEIKKPDSK